MTVTHPAPTSRMWVMGTGTESGTELVITVVQFSGAQFGCQDLIQSVMGLGVIYRVGHVALHARLHSLAVVRVALHDDRIDVYRDE